jgi:hypothetical protein
MALIVRRRAGIGLALCLAVVAALAAAGCGGSNATPPIIYITPTPGPATPTPAPTTPLPSGVTPAPTATPTPGPATPVIGSVVISSDAPDGRWKVTFKKPIVSGIPAPAATKINDAITAKVNSLISGFTGSGLPAVQSGDGPSTLEGDFTTALDSPRLISLRFTVVTFATGAAHPVGTPSSINFVVSSGDTVALTSLFNDPTAALPVLSTQAHAALSADLGADLTWAGPATAMSFFDKAWAMTPAGLEFSWAQGDLASMAAGTPSATLAWTAIKTLIKPSSAAGEFVH